jgi:DNA repair protein RecN (Recombination protein N)
LGDNDFQREVLDALAGNAELLTEYRTVFIAYMKAKKELAALESEQETANTALDYNQFLFDELEGAGFKENELEEIDVEIRLLGNAENIKRQLGIFILN